MILAHWSSWSKTSNRVLDRSNRASADRARLKSKFKITAEQLEVRQLLAVPLVTDHGGSVLKNIQVETVYWNWNTPALMAMANQLNTFAGDVTGSNYWSDLAQYNVDFGSWSGEFNIAGAPPANTNGYGGLKVTTNADVEATLVANLGKADGNGNILPKPDSASTLYLVYLPPGDPFNFTDGTGVFPVAASYSVPGTPPDWTVFGGQHAWNVANNFAYSVIPYPGPVGRGLSNTISPDATSVLSFLTAVSSHELVEAATDAKAYINANGTTAAFGWYFSPRGAGPGYTGGGTEIGDPLSGQDVWVTMNRSVNPAVTDSWFVQLYWSNFIPLSTAPHDWPRIVPRQPSIFKPSPPGTSTPPRPTPPAQPPLQNSTSPSPPIPPSSPSIPGGPSLVQPVIAASPANPSDLAVASQNGLVISTNAGASWSTLIPFPTASGGDSSITYSKSGSLFWSYLNPTTRGITIVTINPTTGAVTAGPFTVDTPAAGSTDVQQELAADNPLGNPLSNNLALVWTQLGPSGSSKILLSLSTNQGKNWLAPVTVAASSGGTPPTYYYGASVTIAPNGSIAVAYHVQPGYKVASDGGIVPDGASGQVLAAVYTYNSTTQQLTQQGSTITALAAGQSDITFNDQAGSRKISGVTFLTQGSVIPQVLVNPTIPGVMYVVSVKDPDAGTNNPPTSEVVIATLTQSANGTWSSSTSVIAAPSSSSIFQLFPAASISPTGAIVVSWYTNQSLQKNASGNYLLDTYATYSTDGGQTWAKPFPVDAQAFDPDAGAANVLSGPPPTTGIGNLFGVAIDGATVFIANDANTFTGNTPTGQQVAVESFAMPGALVIPTSLGNNTYTIRQVSSGANVDEVLVNNVVVAIAPIASLSGGILIGTGSALDIDDPEQSPAVENDTLFIDYSNGDPVPSGGVTYSAAAGGTNLIKVNADANETLGNSSLTISGNSVTFTDIITLTNVNAAQLTGGPSNDTYTLSGWTGTTTIAGGTGTNSLVIASGTIHTSTLTVSGVQSLSVSGTFDVDTSFGGVPTIQVQSLGVLELDNGVILSTNVTNDGTLNLGGGTNTANATIEGNYTQAAGGTLTIKLGGTAAGQFDALSVTGNVSLAGTLTVTLMNSFTPVPGNSFQIITFLGTLTGDFATKNFPALGNGNKFTTSSSPGAYTLSVIA
jgi:hypothetical protein